MSPFQITKVRCYFLTDLFKSDLMCAGDSIAQQGPCQGDSGGPLMIEDTGTLVRFFK